MVVDELCLGGRGRSANFYICFPKELKNMTESTDVKKLVGMYLLPEISQLVDLYYKSWLSWQVSKTALGANVTITEIPASNENIVKMVIELKNPDSPRMVSSWTQIVNKYSLGSITPIWSFRVEENRRKLMLQPRPDGGWRKGRGIHYGLAWPKVCKRQDIWVGCGEIDDWTHFRFRTEWQFARTSQHTDAALLNEEHWFPCMEKNWILEEGEIIDFSCAMPAVEFKHSVTSLRLICQMTFS
jgi:hypothetical protein